MDTRLDWIQVLYAAQLFLDVRETKVVIKYENREGVWARQRRTGVMEEGHSPQRIERSGKKIYARDQSGRVW